MSSKKESLLKKANTLPQSPGVYIMKDIEGKVIYVGKAKKLKNRVTSYFRGEHQNSKTKRLVSEIDTFEYIIEQSELDALLTECSLINQYNPFYNIKLKNGGGYPFICLAEKDGLPYLKLEKSRSGKGRYFGPFISSLNANEIISLVNKTFQLPSCVTKKKNINSYSRNGKGCIEYQIANCKGFCRKDFPKDELKKTFDDITKLFNGNIKDVEEELNRMMTKASDNYDFEYAANIRDRIIALNKITEMRRPAIANNRNADYISFSVNDDQKSPSVTFFVIRVRKGFIISERCDYFKENYSDDLVEEYIERFYSEEGLPNCKVYIDSSDHEWYGTLNDWLKGCLVTPVQKQDRNMLDLCKKNAEERRLIQEGKVQKAQRNIEAFKKFSSIKKLDRIELYDTSSMANELVVCGMIVLLNGEFKPSEYRRFKIEKTLGNDDTAYMKEAVSRRIDRYIENDPKFSPLPDVIICDGSLGQIHAVESILMLKNIYIPVVGLKKDGKHRTKSLVYPDGKELQLIKDREVFAFCTKMQDEVHRYAISYHKALRDALSRQSVLTQIPGVGKKRARELFMKYKSLDRIMNTDPSQISKDIHGISETLAAEIIGWLKENNL